MSADRARAHLAALSAQGVGRKTAADAAKVAPSIVSKIIDRQRGQIRAQTERRILAVTAATAADGAYIDGAPTWLLLDELIASGYSKARVASEIAGRPLRALQLQRGRVTVRNAALARGAYERLRLAAPAVERIAQKQLAELRDEHMRPDRIQRAADELAEARGWAPASISPKPQSGRWPEPAGLTHRAAHLIGLVHARVFDEDISEESA